MKEEKMAMCIGKATNRTTCTETAPILKVRGGGQSRFKNENSIGIASAALLLIFTLSYIGSPILITNRTVSYNIVKF